MPGRQARTSGDLVTAGVERARGVPASTGTAVPAGGDPCRHPWCKRSVAVSWRSGGMTGWGVRGGGAQPRGCGGERSSGVWTAAGLALLRSAMGTTVAGPRRCHELAAAPRPDPSPRPPTLPGRADRRFTNLPMRGRGILSRRLRGFALLPRTSAKRCQPVAASTTSSTSWPFVPSKAVLVRITIVVAEIGSTKNAWP